jgi:hypothetical protein
MKVGDLVKHKSYGSYGTVVDIRNTRDGFPAMATVYFAAKGYSMLHSLGKLEVLNEKKV